MRRQTIDVRIGDLGMGSMHPIRVQSMTTTNTMDTDATIAQSIRMIEAGCELVRITAPSIREAKNLEAIRAGLRERGFTTPLVADIHYTPNAAEIAARVVAHFVKSFKLGKDAYTGAMYSFDPGRDRPPVRRFGNPAAAADMCFFGPGEAPAKLNEVIAAVEQTGALPSNVVLGAPYAAEAVLGVLKHLAVYWSDKPPARASERRATTARITVVPGYFALLDELERDESDALNFSVSSAESWVVENVSENGYGALVPASTTDWIRVGEMIGLQVEGTPQWGIGLVRRVMRDEQRQYHVGIEIISRSVVMVRIAPGEGDAGEGEHAVLLSGTPDVNGEVGLVMRAGRYDPNLNIRIIGRSKSYLFKPSRMLDAGDDFDWANFTVGPLNA